MLTDERRAQLVLPPVPVALADRDVAGWSEPVTMHTYHPEAPDLYPAFLHNRVYQGSSGRVFPLPFHGRIAAEPVEHAWQAVHLENKWLRVMVLPELGGRIHLAYDKIAGADLFYRNNVIKPALVGLTGPWISGGVEFNWPQHHRPATYLPTDFEIEESPDGSVTVWCSDHDPFARMRATHGVRLRPESSRLELVVRVLNRSEVRQSFLWWANVAVWVHDDYQSFFPTDVHFVADHARRAMTTFPYPDRPYYGVDYADLVSAERPDGDRLDWWRNIPVPTSYMILNTADEFFGGYDHAKGVGFVHWASREVSPGKKQWTWGNSPFGEAWERNLTDGDGPYIELMAGVFTDNQPDFAWLLPGEVKEFTQAWYPIREIGAATQANDELAARFERDGASVKLGLMAAEPLIGARVRVGIAGQPALVDDIVDLTPDAAWHTSAAIDGDAVYSVEVDGRVALSGSTAAPAAAEEPATAKEPPAPAEVASVDELWTIGAYLEQYRHATRLPEPYWREALKRDPNDVRSLTSLGALAYRRGQFAEAVDLLSRAVAKQTEWAPSPRDGEPRYLLGLALDRLGASGAATGVLARSAWDGGWADAATIALARVTARTDRTRARTLLAQVVARSPKCSPARDLLVALARVDGLADPISVDDSLAFDPLDTWARDLAGLPLTNDASTLLDTALDYAGAGLDADALRVLDLARVATAHNALGQVEVAPLIEYHRAMILDRGGDSAGASAARAAARSARVEWANALRLDDVVALRAALTAEASDPVAALLLGNWLYHQDQPDAAAEHWEIAAVGSTSGTSNLVPQIALRNLGIYAYNVAHDPDRAVDAYRSARALAPRDGQLAYEADQLAARVGVPTAERLTALTDDLDLVLDRDTFLVTYAQLLTEVGRADEARDLLAARVFQPWEGGEGQVLAAWDTAQLAIARAHLLAGAPQQAVDAIDAALNPPTSLGEVRHFLQADAELHLVRGDALAAFGQVEAAQAEWTIAASTVGDFTNMAVQPYSLQTPWTITALRRLGREADAAELQAGLDEWAIERAVTPATVDYFATSLPTMLLFVDDPNVERDRDLAQLRRTSALQQ